MAITEPNPGEGLSGLMLQRGGTSHKQAQRRRCDLGYSGSSVMHSKKPSETPTTTTVILIKKRRNSLSGAEAQTVR